jgi:hypothetical protein
MFAEFGLEARARASVREKSRKDPIAGGAQAIAFVGAEVMPSEVFTEEYRQSLVYT